MKLSVWAKQNGLAYRTAWRLFKKGQLPVRATQLATGTILVHEDIRALPVGVVLYARVSSHDQKDDGGRQMERLRRFAQEQKLQVVKEVLEIGSGLNGRRKQILNLLADPSLSVVVEHRDRLACFGVELLTAALAANGRQVIVMEEVESKADLLQDMTDILTSLCARVYGQRGAANRAKRALRAASEKA